MHFLFFCVAINKLVSINIRAVLRLDGEHTTVVLSSGKMLVYRTA